MEYGIVMANLVVHGFSQATDTSNVQNITKLLSWKQVRKDIFSQSSPTPVGTLTERVSDKDLDGEWSPNSVQNDVEEGENTEITTSNENTI